VHVVLEFLRECISEPSKSAHLHSHREVLALGKRRAYVFGIWIAFDPFLTGSDAIGRTIAALGLALGPSNERLELLMKRGDWRQAADRFRLLPDCVPRRFGEGFRLKNDGGPEILKGDIVALL